MWRPPQVFEKSEVKVWECRNCGHIVVGTAAPEVCPTCSPSPELLRNPRGELLIFYPKTGERSFGVRPFLYSFSFFSLRSRIFPNSQKPARHSSAVPTKMSTAAR